MIEHGRVVAHRGKPVGGQGLQQRPRFIGGRTDATGIGASLAESGTQRFGESMVGVKFSTEWYRTEMPPVKAAFATVIT